MKSDFLWQINTVYGAGLIFHVKCCKEIHYASFSYQTASRKELIPLKTKLNRTKPKQSHFEPCKRFIFGSVLRRQWRIHFSRGGETRRCHNTANWDQVWGALFVPRTRLATSGDRLFSSFAPHLWNSSQSFWSVFPGLRGSIIHVGQLAIPCMG